MNNFFRSYDFYLSKSSIQIGQMLPALLLFLIICLQQTQSEVFIKYDQLYQSTELVKFFFDFSDGYFVDIGAFDPMTYSNTLFLYSKGWTGINIEASPRRYKQFVYTRNKDVNLNIAIGQTMAYATLYDNSHAEATSTINAQVKKTLQKSELNKITEISVPVMTMKEICHRYYQKQPNYMNLDIEGFSSFALLGNDWSEQKCKPEVITVQINHSFDDSKIKSPQQILKQNGYKYHSKLQLSEIWVEGSVADKYFKKYEEGKKYMEKVPITHSEWILNGLYRTIENRSIEYGVRLDTKNSSLYYYFPKENSRIDLDTVNFQSNLYSQKKNRPILILNQNNQNTAFLVNASEAIVSKFSAQGFQFTNITLKKSNYAFSAYVYGQPKILYVHNYPVPASDIVPPETPRPIKSTPPESRPNGSPTGAWDTPAFPAPIFVTPLPAETHDSSLSLNDRRLIPYLVGSSLISLGLAFIVFGVYLKCRSKSSHKNGRGNRIGESQMKSSEGL